MQTKRVMGIEPTSVAWEANVLPLDDTRESRALYWVLGAIDNQHFGGFSALKQHLLR